MADQTDLRALRKRVEAARIEARSARLRAIRARLCAAQEVARAEAIMARIAQRAAREGLALSAPDTTALVGDVDAVAARLLGTEARAAGFVPVVTAFDPTALVAESLVLEPSVVLVGEMAAPVGFDLRALVREASPRSSVLIANEDLLCPNDRPPEGTPFELRGLQSWLRDVAASAS